MPETNPTGLVLPRTVVSYAPSTFAERGVVVPFTTPQLAGARVRSAERDTLELIVGNPSGGRGVYIFPWTGAFALCSPTVHDRQVMKGMQDLPGVTPAAIRKLSLEVAQQGLAGRAAAAAAEAASAAEAALRIVTNFEMLLMLMRQVFPDQPEPAGGDIEAYAKQAVAAVAPRLHLPADEVARLLAELAGVVAPLGIGSVASQARIPRGIATLSLLRKDLAERLHGPSAVSSLEAELVLSTADLTMACARATTASAAAMLLDLPALLHRWIADPASVASKAARPDWLLDGWERIRLVWEQGGRDQDSLFAELADLVPATPREVAGWVGMEVESPAGLMRHSRKVALNEDWRSGVSMHTVVRRNERLRAMELESTS